MRTTKKGKFFLYLILTLGALLILFPMYITITTTFKTPAESAVSFFTLPKSLYLGNYATVLQDEKLYYAYGNTILITVVSLLGEMLILPPMGFALSRGMKQNRFFKGLYFFFLLGIFLPWQVRMMPVVKLMGWLGLLSPLGITLLYIAHATCESMFLYVGYLATVSDSIEEAAYIDGASTFQIYTRVILPLMTPHSFHRADPRGSGHLERLPDAVDYPEPLQQAVDADHLSEQLPVRAQRRLQPVLCLPDADLSAHRYLLHHHAKADYGRSYQWRR